MQCWHKPISRNIKKKKREKKTVDVNISQHRSSLVQKLTSWKFTSRPFDTQTRPATADSMTPVPQQDNDCCYTTKNTVQDHDKEFKTRLLGCYVEHDDPRTHLGGSFGFRGFNLSEKKPSDRLRLTPEHQEFPSNLAV